MHETWQKDDYVGSHKTDNWKKIQKKKKIPGHCMEKIDV